MDIRESDLPGLPFKVVYWFCIEEGCTNKVRVRDYGISPYYWHPVKIHRSKKGWRGGWFGGMYHYHICSRCRKKYPENTIHDYPEEVYLSRIKTIDKK